MDAVTSAPRPPRPRSVAAGLVLAAILASGAGAAVPGLAAARDEIAGPVEPAPGGSDEVTAPAGPPAGGAGASASPVAPDGPASDPAGERPRRAVPDPVAEPPPPGEAAFLEGLDAVAALMDAERWAEARGALLDLVAEHERRDYVVGKLADLRGLLRRCDFWTGRPRLDPERAISGDLRLDNRTTGRVKVVYDEHHGWSDFELLDPPAGAVDGLVLTHPLDFSGPFSIEVSGTTHGATPTLVVARDGERAWAVDVGLGIASGDYTVALEPRARSRPDARHRASARVVRWDARGATTVAAIGSVPVTGRERYTLRVAVTSRVLEVSYNGKPVLATDGPERLDGQAGILLPAGGPSPFRGGLIESVTLEGTGGSGWLRGLRDALEREAWEEHGRRFDPDAELPDWLLEAEARGVEVPLPDEERRALEALVRAGGPVDGILARLADATARFPRAPGPRALTALVLLDQGRLREADRVLEEAARDGVSDAQLDWLDGLVTQAVAGPDWGRSYEVVTEHYLVRTDLDARACEDAARVLEDAWDRFERDMPALRSRRDERLRVYLFSGQRGFLDYLRESSGIVTHSAAGLYEPRIRQLLIWNLPNEAEMLRTVRHEGLHQWLDDALPDAPRWLHEGLAEYYEHGKDEHGRWRLAASAPPPGRWSERPVPLATFVTLDDAGFLADPVAHYMQSWALVHFLRHGGPFVEGRLDALLAALATDATATGAMASAFAGVDWAAWDAAFVRWVGE